MPKYQVGDAVLAVGSRGARTWAASAPPAPPPASYRAIVSLGESNSGGQGLVSELSAPLAASTDRVKILIHATGLFADMDLGTNNNQGHSGLDASYHAWEAGLTTYLDANPAQLEPVYLIQCGQGGSLTIDWANGGTNWTIAQTRINQAKAAFITLGITPVWEIWFTLGINDFIDGSPPTVVTYKSRCTTLLSEVRTMIGNGTATRIRSPEFMAPIKSSYPTYTTGHEELAIEITNMQIVDTTGLPLDDDFHWSSAGHVSLGQLMAGA